MTELDIRTLLIAAVIAEVLRGLMLGMAWSLRRNEPALAYWAAASLMVATGIFAISLCGAIPDWISIGSAAFLVYGGIGLRWCGMCRFAGQPVRLAWALGPPMLLCLLFLLREPLGLDVNARVVMAGTTDCAYFLAMLVSSVRAQRGEWLSLRRVVIVVICLHLLFEAMRAMHGAFGSLSPTNYLAANSTENLLMLGVLSMGVLFDLACFMMQFERHENRLVRAATLDTLPNLLNRAGFNQLADRQLQRSRRDQQPVSVLVMDLDFFKHINDRHGHDGGDAVLLAFAQSARAALRPSDLLSRPGGEEFWALLPNSNLDAARRIAQRVCDQFRDVQVAFEGRTISATVSIGVVQANAQTESIQTALSRADQALYIAKREGRNRVTATPLAQARV